jgi:hypothetical protein
MASYGKIFMTAHLEKFILFLQVQLMTAFRQPFHADGSGKTRRWWPHIPRAETQSNS